MPKITVTQKCGCGCNQNITRTDWKSNLFGRSKIWFIKNHHFRIFTPRGKMHKHPAWKGGRLKHNGYIYIRQPNHPNAGKFGYISEQRLVMETHIKRYLNNNEIVHHIDGNRKNNNTNNLIILTRNIHQSFHMKERPRKGKWFICLICNKSFYRLPSCIRKHNFCSNQCHTKFKQL